MRMTAKQPRVVMSILMSLVLMFVMPLTAYAHGVNQAVAASRPLLDQIITITRIQAGWIPSFASVLYLVLLACLFLVLIAVIVMSIKFRQAEKRDIS